MGQQALQTNHPSYGCEQAWFMFAVSTGARPVRLLLVEAKNSPAVQAIERIVARDGRASPSCELLTVHRQCPSIGIRSGMVSEVDYVDFMLDVVEPSRIVSDALTAGAFQESLGPEGRARALRKMEEMADPEPEEGPVARVIPMRPRFDPATSGTYQDVLAALTDLGYKKPQAKKAVDALGPAVDGMELSEAVKAALQRC